MPAPEPVAATVPESDASAAGNDADGADEKGSAESEVAAAAGTLQPGSGSADEGGSPRRRRRRRRRGSGIPGGSSFAGHGGSPVHLGVGGVPVAAPAPSRPQAAAPRAPLAPRAPVVPPHAPPQGGGRAEPVICSGVIEILQDGTGFLRSVQHDMEERREDPLVPHHIVQRFRLHQGSLIEARGVRFPNHPGPKVEFVDAVDGFSPGAAQQRHNFKRLVVIDPDFHYELGTFRQEGQVSMRVADLLCPIGRGQRGLIVAPPRTGKTTLLTNIAAAMESLYPDVHLIVLLADERPEEGTAWKRSVQRGEVYVSTMDEAPEHHVRLAELVQARAERLVETGKEVMILLDSITRLTRAYNNMLGGKNARTMSGGLDARVFQQPKHFFGAARNTENGGSLTILATTLVDTGSKMDQVIFEEFKGTGNMELTLDRRLADRRVFPAIDIEHTGTRKEERLLTRATLKKVEILRRVLARLKPREAMEMLIDRLGRYASNQDFLNAFSLDDVQ